MKRNHLSRLQRWILTEAYIAGNGGISRTKVYADYYRVTKPKVRYTTDLIKSLKRAFNGEHIEADIRPLQKYFFWQLGRAVVVRYYQGEPFDPVPGGDLFGTHPFYLQKVE